MGYYQVYTESGIPRVWGKFKMSKGCTYNRQELMTGMVYWTKKNGIEIDTAVFLVKQEMEEMAKTKFNPGGPVAMYESTESGISQLMVTPRTTQETEEDIRQEEVEAESQVTRTQSEALHMKKVDARRLPRNWYELKEMLATFSAFLWVLFEDVCPLYG